MARTAIVLGAGLQGVSVSLALLQRGFTVTVVDQADDCLRRASLRNECKIHLGFLFSNDSSRRSAALMQRGAFRFGPLIEQWVGEAVPWRAFVTRTFRYCLGRTSMLSAEALIAHYEAVEQLYLETLRDPAASYLGMRAARPWRLMDEERDIPALSRAYARPFVHTAEVALDGAGFSRWLRARFSRRPCLHERYGHRVEGVERTPAGFRVSGVRRDGAAWRAEADIVVNCLWEGRLAVDGTIGLLPKRPWVHRLKYRVFVRLPPSLADLPPMTFVIGPFGDIVTFGDGLTYLSYYPISIQGWSSDLEPPRTWEPPCDGRPDPALARDVAARIVATLDDAVPGLRESTIATVDAGAIFTWGTTDIDDPQSELHNRFDVGIQAADGYYSIDTGKYTTAPLFAEELARLI